MINKEKFKGNKNGKIEMCPFQGCEFRCCNFQQGNYIVMYPGEVEEARKKGYSLKHLILSKYHGGHKVICKAKNTASCDSGYKPLDCKSYPFFPKIDSEGVSALLKGSKCPLKVEFITSQLQWVKKTWGDLCRSEGKILEWLSKVVLIGYEEINKDRNNNEGI